MLYILVIIVKYKNVVGGYLSSHLTEDTVLLGASATILTPPVRAEGKHCLSWHVFRTGTNSGSLLLYSWNSTKKNSLLFEAYGMEITGKVYFCCLCEVKLQYSGDTDHLYSYYFRK